MQRCVKVGIAAKSPRCSRTLQTAGLKNNFQLEMRSRWQTMSKQDVARSIMWIRCFCFIFLFFPFPFQRVAVWQLAVTSHRLQRPWTYQQGEFLLCTCDREIKRSQCLLWWISYLCHLFQTASVFYFFFPEFMCWSQVNFCLFCS